MPKLSLCMAALNQGTMLLATVQSAIASLGNADYEIVVVDDGSKDSCCDAVRELPSVRVITNEFNEGYSRASWTAGKRATGMFSYIVTRTWSSHPVD